MTPVPRWPMWRVAWSSGQTVYLRAGTYTQRIAPGTFPGGTSWSAPTTIAAYQNEIVMLQVNTSIVAAFTAPATDRYIMLSRLILDGQIAPPRKGSLLATAQGHSAFKTARCAIPGWSAS